MKKLLALIMALLMLCACGANEEPIDDPQSGAEAFVQENPEDEPEKEEPRNEKIEIIDDISYIGENGKFGFHKEGIPVTEAIFDEINLCQSKLGGKKVYEALFTEGTRLEYASERGKGVFLREVPNTLYYIFDEDANRINDEPLANYYILNPEGFGNGTREWFLDGTYEGDFYRYSVKTNGGYYLHTKQSAGKESIIYNTGEEFFITEYHWDHINSKEGLMDMEGNVILENLYLRITTSGRNGLLYAYIGWAFQTADEVRLEIYDFEGNLINNEYNYMQRIVQDDGYFLVAYCFGESAYEICFDENGNPYEAGYWFVDDYGNKLSERFEYIEVIRYMSEKGGLWQVEKVIVTDENGNEKEIPYEQYKIYY